MDDEVIVFKAGQVLIRGRVIIAFEGSRIHIRATFKKSHLFFNSATKAKLLLMEHLSDGVLTLV